MDIDDVSDQYVPWVKFGIDQLLDSAPPNLHGPHYLTQHFSISCAPRPRSLSCLHARGCTAGTWPRQ